MVLHYHYYSNYYSYSNYYYYYYYYYHRHHHHHHYCYRYTRYRNTNALTEAPYKPKNDIYSTDETWECGNSDDFSLFSGLQMFSSDI